jgi:putative alpha-1,2-mannosidase
VYSLAAPRFDDIRLKLFGGNSLHILARGTEGDRIYVRQVRLNGMVLTSPFLRHDQLVAYGELVIEMTDRPVGVP